MTPATLPERAQAVSALRVAADGPERQQRDLAEETPIALVYGGVSFAVMMATPADLEDFAYGFSLTEGLVSDAAQIRSVTVAPEAEGLRVEITVDGAAMRRVLDRTRTLTGRTGCGLCGIEDLAALPRAGTARAGGPQLLSPPAIRRALRALGEQQPLFRQTGAVHAAAWVEPEGRIDMVREDVGRHNALDKLIGARLRAGASAPETMAAPGFVLVTSRCSYEMVQKASVAGFGAIVAISAPTALAVRLAERAGLTLAAFARGDAMTIYTGAAATDGGQSEAAAE